MIFFIHLQILYMHRQTLPDVTDEAIAEVLCSEAFK